MLFNSPEFLFAFLPLTLGIFFLLARLAPSAGWQQKLPMAWLVLASLFFYAWWEWENLFLLGLSLLVNYQLSQHLIRRKEAGRPDVWALRAGVVFNLALIIWFKYANFFAGAAGAVVGEAWSLGNIVLPLAISFFTFQQISYLVDGHRGKVAACHWLDYAMVVTFFPHLIAGPIVRYQDVLPQFKQPDVFRFDANRIGAGLTLFTLGLFKKMVFADSIAPYANLAFDAVGQGVVLTFTEAWVGALAYTCQLYFDFSGYSDMAIGLAWMFGIRFSLNFNSPYKSRSIQDFWRRWHMTLSAFLRDYLYIALGGNRRGEARRQLNLFLTMLLGGLWHGAGFTFLIWGALHGSYLIINHSWRDLTARWGYTDDKPLLPNALAWLLTMLCVVVAWVLFRAVNVTAAFSMLGSMLGMHGIELPNFLAGPLGFLEPLGVGFGGFTANVGIAQKYSIGGIVILLFIAVVFPNTQQIMGRFNPALEKIQLDGRRLFSRLAWRPGFAWSALAGLLAAICVLCLTRVSQFIYFQF
ncbi:MAG: MBOAT family protein [Pseudomonadota bacterium]